MSQLHKSLFVPFSTQNMFDIVNDISAYPQFLPWCGGTKILSSTETMIAAEITIAKGPVKTSFSTINRIEMPHRIMIQLKEGPFKQLSGQWRFEPRGDNACQITLTMDFEFSSLLLSMSIGPVFEQIVGSLITAFKQRADAIHRKSDL